MKDTYHASLCTQPFMVIAELIYHIPGRFKKYIIHLSVFVQAKLI